MAKISQDVLESYVACHYKAYLKLAGHEGTPADGPTLPPSGEAILPTAVVDEVRPQRLKVQAINSVELTPSFLSKGLTPIWNGVFETDLMSLHIAGLQRVDGPSNIGDFHYLPLVLQSGSGSHETRRLLLDVYGFILSNLQGRVPDQGIIWKGEENSSTVQHSPDLRRGERILKALREIQQSEPPPMLILRVLTRIVVATRAGLN